MGIFEEIERAIRPGMAIPKPQTERDFVVKGFGIRRGQPALIYFIPNNKNPANPYQKGITNSEWVAAFQQLERSGEFSREWFEKYLPNCAKEGGCNFKTIGGIFQLLKLADYERGRYRRVQSSDPPRRQAGVLAGKMGIIPLTHPAPPAHKMLISASFRESLGS